MLPYSIFYCLVDTAVIRQAVSWFNVAVRYVDVLPIRATTYILSLINQQLGHGGLALFLHRRYGIPFLQVTSTVLLLAFVEIYQLAFYSFLGATFAGELGRAAPATVYATLAVYLAVHLWFFSKPRGGKLGEMPILAAFRRARPIQYLLLVLYKTPNLLAAVTVHWLALPLFGMEVPFVKLLTFLPLVFFASAFPAAAKLGPAQAAWVYFFGDVAPAANLVAYSLAAHLTFLVLNATLGLPFLSRATRALHQPSS